jgi:2-haloalkanoic acid dehalogenase type II
MLWPEAHGPHIATRIVARASPPERGRRVTVELVTFDCYGTLIDWRGGILRAIRERVPASAGVDPETFFAAYMETEAETEAGPWRPYRDILSATVARLIERFGWPTPPEGTAFLAESLPGWEPFPDVAPALTGLRARGYRLGILSNVDDDLLVASVARIGVPFDVLITAERVRSYKPAPAHFEAALAEVGGDTSRLVHMAQSHYHDVAAAVPLGIATVWVNRRGEPLPGPPEPTAEHPDLSAAAGWLLATGGRRR